MREIKFRAWYFDEWEEKGRMIEWRDLHIETDEDGLFMWVGDEGEENNFGSGSGTNSFTLMQYTGLKDKNGKEIYEGDIVNYSHPRTNEIIRTVTFKHGAFGIEGIYEKTHIIFGNILDSHIEVIGNIYENPELLTV